MAITQDDILEAVGNMSVMDLNAMVKAFEEKFGVSAAAMAVAGPAGGAGAGAAALLSAGLGDC
jgi:large subunit ribosomal protein L7/L12